jgi:hypothetical protein
MGLPLGVNTAPQGQKLNPDWPLGANVYSRKNLIIRISFGRNLQLKHKRGEICIGFKNKVFYCFKVPLNLRIVSITVRYILSFIFRSNFAHT